MGVKAFDVMSFCRAKLIEPEQVGYEDSIEIIHEELHKTRKSFIKIGWYLKHIHDNNMYTQEGYANIYDFAMEKFRFSQPTTTRYINLCEEFSVDHNSPELDQKYEDYNISQLFEMLSMSKDKIEQVTPDMTVNEIREIKKPSSRAIKAFYVNFIMKTEFANNREGLKQYLIDKFGKSNCGGACGGLTYHCRRKGIRLNESTEITWTNFVKSINELIPVTVSNDIADDNIPGQTSIEKNFPEYLHDNIYATSHKEQKDVECPEHATSCMRQECGFIPKEQDQKEQIIDGEYREIEKTNLSTQSNELKEIVSQKDKYIISKHILEQEKSLLNIYQEAGESEMTILRQRIIVEALTGMVCNLKKLKH